MLGLTVEFKTAKSQGLVNQSTLVAYHVPVIAVQKGNPKEHNDACGLCTTRPEGRPWRCQCHGHR